jgi:hypothetical protein
MQAGLCGFRQVLSRSRWGKRQLRVQPALSHEEPRKPFCVSSEEHHVLQGDTAMRRLLAALGTAALVMITTSAVQASPVEADVQSLTDHEVAYAKKGGWHGGGKGWKHGRAWGHHRGWHRGPPPWAPAHGYRRKYGYGYRW